MYVWSTYSRVGAGFGDISLVVRGAVVDVRSRVRVEICGSARRLACGMDRKLLGLRRGIGRGSLVDSRGRQAIVGQRLGIDSGERANALSGGCISSAIAVTGGWRLVTAVGWCRAHGCRTEGLIDC